MPTWTQPPKSAWELLKEYVDANYAGTSLACDAGRRLTHVQNDAMSEEDFELMMVDLKAKFPGAF